MIERKRRPTSIKRKPYKPSLAKPEQKLLQITTIYPSCEVEYNLKVKNPNRERNNFFYYKVCLVLLKFNNNYETSEFHFKVLNSKNDDQVRILSANRYGRIWWLYAS